MSAKTKRKKNICLKVYFFTYSDLKSARFYNFCFKEEHAYQKLDFFFFGNTSYFCFLKRFAKFYSIVKNLVIDSKQIQIVLKV